MGKHPEEEEVLSATLFLHHAGSGWQGRLSPDTFSPRFGVKSPAVPESSAMPLGSSLLINTLGKVSLGASA